MTFPDVVSRQGWMAARKTLREKEKIFARTRKELNAERRKLPICRIEDNRLFEGPDGLLRLQDVFEGRRQLVIYHFWFQPGEKPSEGCSLWVDDLGDLGGDFANLHRHDTSLAFVSRAPQKEIQAVKTQRDWKMPWFTVVDEAFNEVTGYDGWAQISIFVREGEHKYLADIVPMEDLTAIGNHWTILERCPFGLKEG